MCWWGFAAVQINKCIVLLQWCTDKFCCLTKHTFCFLARVNSSNWKWFYLPLCVWHRLVITLFTVKVWTISLSLLAFKFNQNSDNSLANVETYGQKNGAPWGRGWPVFRREEWGEGGGSLIATVLHLPLCLPQNNSAESITANLCLLHSLSTPAPSSIYAVVAAGLTCCKMCFE